MKTMRREKKGNKRLMNSRTKEAKRTKMEQKKSVDEGGKISISWKENVKNL